MLLRRFGCFRNRDKGWLVAVLVTTTLVIPGIGRAADSAQSSIKGRYRVTFTPSVDPVPLNQWHDWLLRIESASSRVEDLREITINGGMPEHGHGLPSALRIVPNSKSGEYRVEGMRFNMPGQWEFQVMITDSAGSDGARFSIRVGPAPAVRSNPGWSESERALLSSLWIGNLPPPPPDPSNRFADDPRAVALGHRLFFAQTLSHDRTFSCATCHQPAHHFADGLTTGHGRRNLSRNTPSLVGAGYSTWLFWDGRRDSLWAQALSPIEADDEMNTTRIEAVRSLAANAVNRDSYEALFGPLPNLSGLPRRASPQSDTQARQAWEAIPLDRQNAINRAFVNLGKAIAAYERQLVPGPSAFDRYVEAVLRNDDKAAAAILDRRAVSGLRLFLSDNAQCLRCHNGPLFTNQGFHNIGTGVLTGERPDFGRAVGRLGVLANEFNCLTEYNDDPQRECRHIAFLNPHGEVEASTGAFKVPSLRNSAATAPYMHDGRYPTLAHAVAHYRNMPRDSGSSIEFRPMSDLTSQAVEAMAMFLESLQAPVRAPAELLAPPH